MTATNISIAKLSTAVDEDDYEPQPSARETELIERIYSLRRELEISELELKREQIDCQLKAYKLG